MNQTIYDIEPITRTKLITKMKIEVMSILLFESCNIRILFCDDDNSIIDCKILIMENEDYTNWSNDDNYIIDFVKKNI
jgi:hypothetical protein